MHHTPKDGAIQGLLPALPLALPCVGSCLLLPYGLLSSSSYHSLVAKKAAVILVHSLVHSASDCTVV